MSPHDAHDAPAGHLTYASTAGRWVLVAAVLGTGMASIDTTVVNVALPALGRDLGAGFATLQWTVSSYNLVVAALVLLGGSLADRYGRRRVFMTGTAWFALASLACALAPTAATLIAARALQGVGAALLVPGSLTILQTSFAPGDRVRAVGAWAGLGGVAAAAGPFVGGWLVEHASWRAVFLINAPLAAVVLVAAARHVPESRDPSATRLDVPGAVLGALGLAGITAALIQGLGSGALPVVLGAAGVVAGVAFVLVERRSRHPMLPLGIFASREFTATAVVTFLFWGGFGVVTFLLVIQLQVVSGFSALAAGIALLPTTVVMLLLASRSGALAARIGPRAPMSVGPVVVALGLLLMVRIGPHASYVTDVLPAVLVLSLGFATTVVPLTATALSTAPPEHAGLASGVNNAVSRVASLVAIALLPALVGLSGQAYRDPVALDASFHAAVVVAAVAVAAGGVLSALTIRSGTR